MTSRPLPHISRVEYVLAGGSPGDLTTNGQNLPLFSSLRPTKVKTSRSRHPVRTTVYSDGDAKNTDADSLVAPPLLRALAHKNPSRTSTMSRSTGKQMALFNSSLINATQTALSGASTASASTSVHTLLTETNAALKSQAQSVALTPGAHLLGGSMLSARRGRYAVVGAHHALHNSRGTQADVNMDGLGVSSDASPALGAVASLVLSAPRSPAPPPPALAVSGTSSATARATALNAVEDRCAGTQSGSVPTLDGQCIQSPREHPRTQATSVSSSPSLQVAVARLVTGTTARTHAATDAPLEQMSAAPTARPFTAAASAAGAEAAEEPFTQWRAATLAKDHLQEQVATLLRDRERLEAENAVLRTRSVTRSHEEVVLLEARAVELFARIGALEAGEERYCRERAALVEEVEESREALQLVASRCETAERRVSELEGSVAAMESERKEKEAEYNRACAVTRRLESLNASLQKTMARSRQQAQELSAQVEALDTEARAAKQRKSELEVQLAATQESEREYARLAREAEAEARDAQAEKAAIAEVLEAAQQHKSTHEVESEQAMLALRRECHAFLQAASEAQDALAEARRVAAREKEDADARLRAEAVKVVRLDEERQRVQAALEQSRRDVEVRENENVRLVSELSAKTEEAAREAAARAEVERELQKRERALGRAEEQLRQSQKRLTKASAKLEQSEAARTQLASQRAAAEEKARVLSLQVDVKERELLRVQRELEELAARYKALVDQHYQCDYKLQLLRDQAQAQVDALSRETAQKQAMLQAATKALEQQRARNLDAERAHSELVASVQEEKRRNDEAMHKLVAAAKRLQKRGDEFDHVLQGKQQEIHRLEEKLRTALKDAVLLRGESDRQRGELGGVRERVRTLEAQLRATEEEKDKSGGGRALSELSSQVKRLTAQNQDLKSDVTRLRSLAVLAEEAHKHCGGRIRQLQAQVRRAADYARKHDLPALALTVEEEEEDVPLSTQTTPTPASAAKADSLLRSPERQGSARASSAGVPTPLSVFSPNARAASAGLGPRALQVSPLAGGSAGRYFPSTPLAGPATTRVRGSRAASRLTPWAESDTESVEEVDTEPKRERPSTGLGSSRRRPRATADTPKSLSISRPASSDGHGAWDEDVRAAKSERITSAASTHSGSAMVAPSPSPTAPTLSPPARPPTEGAGSTPMSSPTATMGTVSLRPLTLTPTRVDKDEDDDLPTPTPRALASAPSSSRAADATRRRAAEEELQRLRAAVERLEREQTRMHEENARLSARISVQTDASTAAAVLTPRTTPGEPAAVEIPATPPIAPIITVEEVPAPAPTPVVVAAAAAPPSPLAFVAMPAVTTPPQPDEPVPASPLVTSHADVPMAAPSTDPVPQSSDAPATPASPADASQAPTVVEPAVVTAEVLPVPPTLPSPSPPLSPVIPVLPAPASLSPAQALALLLSLRPSLGLVFAAHAPPAASLLDSSHTALFSFPGLAADAPRPQAGLPVHRVGPHSPAAAAGVRAGDVLVAVNGSRCWDRPSFLAAVGDVLPGDEATFALMRPRPRAADPAAEGAAPEGEDYTLATVTLTAASADYSMEDVMLLRERCGYQTLTQGGV